VPRVTLLSNAHAGMDGSNGATDSHVVFSGLPRPVQSVVVLGEHASQLDRRASHISHPCCRRRYVESQVSVSLCPQKRPIAALRCPRCKSEFDFLRSVRVQPCIRPIFAWRITSVAMQPQWLLALMRSADRSRTITRAQVSRRLRRVFRSTVSTVSHQRRHHSCSS